jgi:hypothetical protein
LKAVKIGASTNGDNENSLVVGNESGNPIIMHQLKGMTKLKKQTIRGRKFKG